VVTEGGQLIKASQHRGGAARRKQRDSARDQRAPSDRRTEFLVVNLEPCTGEKVEKEHERSFENNERDQQPGERDKDRAIDWQPAIMRAENRPQKDPDSEQGQDNEGDGRNDEPVSMATPHDQAVNYSPQPAHEKLTHDHRANS